MMRRTLTSALLTIALTAAAPSWAIEPAAPLDPEEPASSTVKLDQARKLHKEGAEHYRNGDYDKAYVALDAAYKIVQHYTTAGLLGSSEAKLGKHRDAAKHLHVFLEALPSGERVDERQIAENLFAKALIQVGRLSITTEPAGATIQREGEPLAEDDKLDSLFVKPGTHTFVARLDGYEPTRLPVVVGGGEEKTVTLKLLRPTEAAPVWPIVAGSATGVALIGVGIALHVVANGNRSDAEALAEGIRADGGHCTLPPALGFESRCADLSSGTSEAKTLSDAGVGTLVAGGAVIATGLAVWLFWPQSSGENAVRLSPAVGRTNGLWIEADFDF